MNNEKDKYSEWMDRIKAFQPKIADPQKLMTKTILHIDKRSQKKVQNRMLILVIWTSSMAASLLIGLFLFEQFLPSENITVHYSAVMPDYVLEKPGSLSDFNRWLNHKKERQQKLRDLYTKIVVKH